MRIESLVPRWRYIDFLIDTGSSLTIIHPHDALYRLMLPQTLLQNPSAWPGIVTAQGVSGDTRLFRTEAQLGLLDGDVFRDLRLPVSIAQITAHNREVPSLLGWDVLSSMDVRISRAHGIVELEFQGP